MSKEEADLSGEAIIYALESYCISSVSFPFTSDDGDIGFRARIVLDNGRVFLIDAVAMHGMEATLAVTEE